MKSEKKVYLKRIKDILQYIENINNNNIDAPIPYFDIQFDVFETEKINKEGVKLYNQPNLKECSKNIKCLETQLKEIDIKYSKLIKYEQDEILNKIDEINNLLTNMN